jgi:hypothetical protein
MLYMVLACYFVIMENKSDGEIEDISVNESSSDQRSQK